MSVVLFPEIERESLEEDAKENYEFYTGIALDTDHNKFKIVTGKYKDKKDMYYKLRKRGLSMRKCYEDRVWKWIEDNAKTALDGYLMYSTAVSKWRNNNMLADYYVKLLNDIPELNRERQKGNPNTRGPAKKGWKEALEKGITGEFPLKEDGDKPYRADLANIDFDGASKHTVRIFPLELIKDNKGNPIYNTRDILDKEGNVIDTVPDKLNPETKRMAAFDPEQGGKGIVLKDVLLFDTDKKARRLDNPRIYRTIFDLEHGKFSPLSAEGRYQSPFGEHPNVQKLKDEYLASKPAGVSDEQWLKDAPEDMRRKFAKAAYPAAYEFVIDDDPSNKRGIILLGSDVRTSYKSKMLNSDYEWRPKSTVLKQVADKHREDAKVHSDLKQTVNAYKDKSKEAFKSGDKEGGWKSFLMADRGKGLLRQTRSAVRDSSKQLNTLTTEMNPVNNLSQDEYVRLSTMQASVPEMLSKLNAVKSGKLEMSPEELQELKTKYQATTAAINRLRTKSNNTYFAKQQDDSLEDIARYAKERHISASNPIHGGDPEMQFSAGLDRKAKLLHLLDLKKKGATVYKDELGNIRVGKPMDFGPRSPKARMVPKKDTNKMSTAEKLADEAKELAQNKKDLAAVSAGSHDSAYLKDLIKRREENIKALKAKLGLKDESFVNDGVDIAFKSQPAGGEVLSKGSVLNLGGVFVKESSMDEAETKTDLNQVLFDGMQLKDEVRLALYKIADLFKLSLTVDVEPVDIYFTGSSANYNYNDQSDIDLHLVYDFEEVGVNAELLKAYFNAAKQNFNHNYSIKVKGIPVEIGVENLAEPLMSTAIYSIKDGMWVKEPTAKGLENLPNVDMPIYHKITADIEEAIQSKDAGKIAALWEKLGKLRKESLKAEGEFGAGNALFKKLRNFGYLKRLKDAYYTNKSEEMSLESLEEI